MSVQMLVRLAARYLLGRKLRTVLTTLSIVMGVMIVFGLRGMIPAMADSLRRNLMTSVNQVDLTVTSETRGVFDSNMVERVGATPGVAHVTGSLVRPVSLPAAQAPATADGVPVRSFVLNGIDPPSAAEVRPMELVEGFGEGRLLAADDRDAIVIPDSLAGRTGLKVGDTLALPSASGAATLRVVGVVAGRPSAGAVDVYVPLATAQALFNAPGQINTIEAIFSPGSDAETVRRDALASLGAGFKAGGSEAGGELMASIKIGEIAFTMFGVLALIMGAFIIFNTFRTVVLERRRDIGMLRAVGASRRTILGLILTESLVQGAVGTAVGLGAGYVLVAGLLALMSPLAEKVWHFPLAGPSFSAGTFVLSVVLGLGVTVVGGLAPALSASRLTPLEALRPMAPVVAAGGAARRRTIWGLGTIVVALLGLVSGNIGVASLAAILFVAGLVLVTPALVRPISVVFGRLLALAFAREGRIAQGNLVRQPGRAAVTASAVMIGLGILVAMAGMATSIYSGILGYLDKGLGTADYLLMPQSLVLAGGNVGAGPELAQALRDTPGVAAVTSLRLATARLGETDLQVIGIDPATYPELSGLMFSEGEPGNAYAEVDAGRSIIVNGLLAAQRKLKVGGQVTLLTPEGPRTYRVVGIGTDYLNAKLLAGFISQANLRRDFHEATDVLVMASRRNGADAGEVRAALENIVRRYPAFTVMASGEWRETTVADGMSKIGFLYVLLILVAVVPSLIALVNTLAINVLERTREIGVLRAVGATRRQVRRVVLAEGLLLAAAGTGFGILSGVVLGYVLVGALRFGGFTLPYFFPYAPILLTVAVGLLLGVLGALIPARQAARVAIVEALHYE